MTDRFFKFIFQSNLLYIGERIKKGTFKPSISHISSKYRVKKGAKEILPLPYSTITGSIESLLGENKKIYAIGKILRCNREYMSVAPYDVALNTSKLPITIEYLSNVEGEIFIKKTEDFNSPNLLGNEFYMGGLKSKGLGRCEIISSNEIIPKLIEGEGVFLSRIYYDDEILSQFGISKENITKTYFGYLFRKTTQFDGYYQKSIFENTIIKNCYNFLVEVIKWVR